MADEPLTTETPETPENPAESGVSLLDNLYGPSEETADEPESSEAPQEAAPEEGSEEQVEEVEITTVEELAEHFQIDPEWIPNLKITQKVNGQPVEFSISEALATHMKVAAADSYLAEAKQKAKAIEEEARQKEQAVVSTLASFSKLVESVEAELDKDIKNIDWNRLREDDPAEYAAKKADIKERRERLDKMKQEAAASYQETLRKAAEAQQKLLQERLPQEQQIFLERVPEWLDSEKKAQERDELVKYLSEEGFSEQDIQVAAFNGRLLALAVKAMRYDKAKTRSEAAKKKVVKIPKVMKPGSKSKPTPKPNGVEKKDAVSILYG